MSHTMSVVEAFYRHCREGDLDSIRGIVSAEAKFVSSGPKDRLPWSGEWNGPDGVVEYLSTIASHTEHAELDVVETIEQGPKAVTVCHIRTTDRGCMVTNDTLAVHLWEIRDEKIVSFREFYDTYQAVQVHCP